MDADLVAHAHDLVENNRYLTLATTDADGHPWASPVYFTADAELLRFYWMSTQTSRHSENLAARPEVSFAIYDSTVPPYHGRCLYAAGIATPLSGDALRAGLTIYPGPEARGGSAVTEQDVSGTSPWRLYCAEASDLSVLCPREPGQPCDRHGRSDDHRQPIR